MPSSQHIMHIMIDLDGPSPDTHNTLPQVTHRRHFLRNTGALIFVVDSTARHQMDVAAKEFESVMRYLPDPVTSTGQGIHPGVCKQTGGLHRGQVKFSEGGLQHSCAVLYPQHTWRSVVFRQETKQYRGWGHGTVGALALAGHRQYRSCSRRRLNTRREGYLQGIKGVLCCGGPYGAVLCAVDHPLALQLSPWPFKGL
jgi:hypothetical protein